MTWHQQQTNENLILPMLMPKQKHDNTPSKDVKSGLFLLRYGHIPFLNWCPSLPSPCCFCLPWRAPTHHNMIKEEREEEPIKKIVCKWRPNSPLFLLLVSCIFSLLISLNQRGRIALTATTKLFCHRLLAFCLARNCRTTPFFSCCNCFLKLNGRIWYGYER